MSDHYNQQTAKHYASYRPPLHKIVLKRMFSEKNIFATGVDIGCGTGYSTVALADYCSKIVGIDPSQPMLDKVTKHEKVTYLKGTAEKIPLRENTTDVVTFAGSLFYANLKSAATEIQRICKRDARVILYDFEILLDEILDQFNIIPQSSDKKYDYTINLSGISYFDELTVKRERIKLEFNETQLAHLLLSDHDHFKKISGKYSTQKPFERVEAQLKKTGNRFSISADIYYSVYRLSE